MKESKLNISNSIKTILKIVDSLLVVFIIFMFLLKNKFSSLIYPINVSFFMLLTFFCYRLLGYKKNKMNKIKEKINNAFMIFSILYLITIYLAGNVTGFLHNSFNIESTLYIILSVIFIEIFRYIFLNKCTKKSNQHYIITFIFILYDILVLSPFSTINNLSVPSLFTIILISIIKNILLSYTTYKFGFYPCILYSLIILMPNFIPIYPNLGNYLTLVFIIIYSAILFYNISKPIRKSEEESANSYKKSFLFYFERVVLVFIIVIIFLVSGTFKYTLSAIASDSMYPELKRGDAVILEKLKEDEKESLSVGMIVAFEQDGEVITHRILAIEEDNGEKYIITKGDNNYTKDVTKKTKDDIIGIVKLRIPLLGYPSVEISEIRNK